VSRFVYIPVEKKNRELQSKVLVALALLEGGANVVLGFQKAVFALASQGPPGVIFYKGLNKVQHDYMTAMARAGHAAVAIDEESLASSDPKFLMLNCWPEIAGSVTKVLCQGDVQRQALIDLRGMAPDQLVITGNARIDLLRPPFTDMIRATADEIRRVHGRFVLINTDYGSINNATMDLEGFREILVKVGYVDPTSPEDLDLMEDRVAHDQNAMASVEAFILAMEKAAPDRKLILRPHPTESGTHWRDLASRVSNLTVVTGTRAPEWIMAADCLIQTGCTTGVEAAILGTPTMGMVCQPDEIVHPSLILTHQVNPVVRSVEAAVDGIARLDAGTAPELAAHSDEKRRLLEPHVHIAAGEFAYRKASQVILELLAVKPSMAGQGVSEISAELDKRLRQSVTRANFQDAFFDLGEVEAELFRLSAALGGAWDGTVRDLGWGAYALSREPGGNA
jgi:surface carbohydrate biosynthesis protein